MSDVAADDGRGLFAGLNGRGAKRRQALKERDGNRCFYCGFKMKFLVGRFGEVNHPRFATIEHLLDRKYGGTDALTNLVLAHRRCNNDRAEMPLLQKLQSRSLFARSLDKA